MFGGVLMFEKTGEVVTINPSKCTARVKFDEDGSISAELQVVTRSSSKNKDYWMPKIKEQVYCSFTQEKKGFIVGSVYSEVDVPPVTDDSIRALHFEDGTKLEYNTKSKTLSIDCVGPITIKSAGNINVIGDVIADGISLKNHTHVGTTPPVGGA